MDFLFFIWKTLKSGMHLPKLLVWGFGFDLVLVLEYCIFICLDRYLTLSRLRQTWFSGSKHVFIIIASILIFFFLLNLHIIIFACYYNQMVQWTLDHRCSHYTQLGIMLHYIGVLQSLTIYIDGYTQ
jgi:hypothetical protein